MAQLAEANNAVYRDLRDLGPNAPRSAIMATQQKYFNPALRALRAEHEQKYLSWRKAIRDNFRETKEDWARILGLTGKAPKGASGEKKAAEDAKPLSGRIGAQTDTGVQGGATGATDAKFGGKRQDNVPKVDDSGIIQEK